MADQVNNGNDHPALKPSEAASTNDASGFQSFAAFEAQMEKEGAANGGAATVENDGGVRPSSQIADAAKAAADEAALKAAEAAGEDPEDEDEDDEVVDDKPVEQTPEQKEAAEKAAADAGPKKTGLKKRLGELVREKHEANRETAQALAERDAAIAERDAARAGQPPKPTAKAAPNGKQPAPVSDEARPNVEDYELGEYDDQYKADMIQYHVDKALQARDARTAEATEQQRAAAADAERNQRWGTTIEKGAAKNADFEDKVLNPQGKWKLSRQVWEMSVDSEVGDDVLYHLASNPLESERIFALPLTRQAAEFGKLEARFSQPPSGKDKSEVKDGADARQHMPRAPAPQTRVRGAGGQYRTDAGTKDFAAFEAMVKAEEAAKAAQK